METKNAFDNGSIKLKQYLELKSLYENGKYNKFEILANEYLDKYPTDILIRFRRAKVLRSQKKFDSALVDLKYILSVDSNNQYALTELFYIYYYLRRYDSALKLLPKMYEDKTIKGDSLALAELVMKVYLGIEYNNQKNKRCEYVRNQIINYDRNRFIQLLIHHDNPDKVYETNSEISHFNKSINLIYLLESVELNLKNAERVNKCEIMDVYYFAVSNVGYNDNNICNYIKVIVVPNTKNIISMYPTSEIESDNIQILNCDYDKLFKRKQNQKTISRVNKFKNKYNM